eukprot:gene30088-36340_t
MNGLVEQARSAFADAERTSNPTNKVKAYLEAADKYLQASVAASDNVLKKVLLQYSEVAKNQAEHLMKIKESDADKKKAFSLASSPTTPSAASDVAVLSNRFILKAHTDRLSNLSKLPKLATKATKNIEDLVAMEAILRKLVDRQEDSAFSSSSMSATSFPHRMQESYMVLPNNYALPPPQSPSYKTNQSPAPGGMRSSVNGNAPSSSPSISLLQYFWGSSSSGSSSSQNARPANSSSMNNYSIQAIEQKTWGEGGGEEILEKPVRVRQTSHSSDSGLDASDPYMVIRRLNEQNALLEEENQRLKSDMQKFAVDFEAKFTDLKLLLKELEKHKVYLDDLASKTNSSSESGKSFSPEDVASLQAQLALVRKENEKLDSLLQGFSRKHMENMHEIKKRNDILFKLEELTSKAHNQLPYNKYLDKAANILHQIRLASLAHANKESTNKEGQSAGSSGRSTEYSYIQVTRDGSTSPSSPGKPTSSASSTANNPAAGAAGMASGMNLSGIRKPMTVPKHPSTATLVDALNRSSSLPAGHNPPAKPAPPSGR